MGFFEALGILVFGIVVVGAAVYFRKRSKAGSGSGGHAGTGDQAEK